MITTLTCTFAYARMYSYNIGTWLAFLCSVHVYRIVRIGEISPVLTVQSHIIYSQYGIHSTAYMYIHVLGSGGPVDM